jgi:hypothetical protein
MNYIILLIAPIIVAFLLNRFMGGFLSIMLQGILSYFSGYTLVKFFGFGDTLSGLQLIITGVALAFVFNYYSRTQDESEGPSVLRAEIQGVGVWMAVTAVILAILN